VFLVAALFSTTFCTKNEMDIEEKENRRTNIEMLLGRIHIRRAAKRKPIRRQKRKR